MQTVTKVLLGAGVVGAAVLADHVVKVSRISRARRLGAKGDAEPLYLTAGSFSPEERALIWGAYRQSRGKTKKTAKILGLGYRTALRRLHEQGIPVKRGAPRKRVEAKSSWWPW